MTLSPQTSPVISAIVPAYNEGQGLAIAIKTIAEILDTCGSTWEIIVVDDGRGQTSGEVIYFSTERTTKYDGVCNKCFTFCPLMSFLARKSR